MFSESEYQKMIKDRNSTNAFAAKLGISITEMSEGHAVTEMDVDPSDLNPIGSVHGGCLYTMADVACGAAVFSYGDKITTLNCSFNYMRPGLHTTHLKAIGKVAKHGKHVSVVDVLIEDQDGKILSSGTFTFMTLS